MSCTSTSPETDCQSPSSKAAFIGFELRAGRAHQVAGSAPPQPLEIFFAHNSAVKDPHPPGAAVFALHRLEHVLQGPHIGPVALEDFIGKRKAFRSDNQRDNDLFAVGPVIARVAAPGFLDLFNFAFKVGACQIVKQHIEAGSKEVVPPEGQMLFQGFLVLDHVVQRAIKAILFRHPFVTLQQRRHGRLRKPFLVDGKLAARRNEPIDRQEFHDFLPSHRADLLAQHPLPELSQAELFPQLASYPARPELPWPPHHQAGKKHLGHILGRRRGKAAW